MIRIILTLALVALASTAEARPLHKDCNILWPCVAASASTPEQARVIRGRYIARQMGFGSAIERPVRKSRKHVSAVSSTIVAHPAGCPRSAFCGCGAAVEVFGSPIRSLWLAANWYKFPRTAPAAGMVAVRRHHVFVLRSHLGGDTWLAFDANSGRHQTRIHARSLAGYVVVNPHG